MSKLSQVYYTGIVQDVYTYTVNSAPGRTFTVNHIVFTNKSQDKNQKNIFQANKMAPMKMMQISKIRAKMRELEDLCHRTLWKISATDGRIQNRTTISKKQTVKLSAHFVESASKISRYISNEN